MNRSQSWALILPMAILFLLTGCQADEKPVSNEQTLIIASDYLEESDTVFFREFSAKYNTRVRIVHMNADHMIGHFRNRKYDNGIDIIMLRSLYDVNRLSRNNLFHSIEQIPEIEMSEFNSHEYNYIGIGINPYVLTHKKGTNHHFNTYNELREKPFYTALENNQLVPLFAGIMPTHHKVGTFEWVKDFNQQRNINPGYDSTENNYCLTLFDEHHNALSDTIYSKYYGEIHYPNQHGKGMLYDLRTVAIVDQAENFTCAGEFIAYYLKKKNNSSLCSDMNVISIHNEQNFRLNRVAPSKLIQYYVLVERMLTKLDAGL